MPVVRILVADDFNEWRVRTREILRARPEWQITDASDGAQAVQRAAELQPDIVLLDIGMPIMNGMEAAKQIRQAAPSAKIIFVSQENDEDIIRAALETGAEGYLSKQDAASRLVATVAAALRNGHPR